MRSVEGDVDLTARASIRNEALRLFAAHGPDAVSVRQIAAAAGVSPALVLHHFGSKAGLREAVDRYAAAQFDGLLGAGEEIGEILTSGATASVAELFSEMVPADSPLPGYFRRLLLTADPVALALFRRWFDVSRALLDQMTAAGVAAESEDPDVRAAFLLAADLVLLVLREPIAEVLGVDPLSPEGMNRWAGEVARIYRDGAFSAPSPSATSTP
jgi:AcrR family transcriptional regulator